MDCKSASAATHQSADRRLVHRAGGNGILRHVAIAGQTPDDVISAIRQVARYELVDFEQQNAVAGGGAGGQGQGVRVDDQAEGVVVKAALPHGLDGSRTPDTIFVQVMLVRLTLVYCVSRATL